METYNVLCTTNAVLQDELKIRKRFKNVLLLSMLLVYVMHDYLYF